MDIAAALPDESAAAAFAAGQQAQRAEDYERALELFGEAAAAHELPPAELCLSIARCHDALTTLDDAFTWIVRAVEADDSFMAWTSAASMLARLTQRARPTARTTRRLAVTGSYTITQLASMLPLAALRHGVDLVFHEGLYGQYEQDLLDSASALYRFEPDLILLAVHEGALQLPRFSDEPDEAVAAEVQRWERLWQAAKTHSDASIVQHNFAVRPEAAYGHLSAALSGSRYAMTQEANRELHRVRPDHVSIVDCERLSAQVGRSRWFDDRYWFRSKQAVALDVLPLLARHTAGVIAARAGLSRKCLVLDLDNTLWGGVVGEDGLAGIALGGEGIGEAFVAFQEFVLELKERGVILAVASKNNEADAREVFERHPEMRIRLDNIAVFAVNWEDKPANLRRIAQTLDIGVDALVLADDNPAERQLVRRLLPEVDVLALPAEPTHFRRALADYLGFESVAITTEDRGRAEQYRARAAAVELRSSAADLESFLRDLRMRATIAPFDELHLPRIAQLVAKTNQFNLTTRRYGSSQLSTFLASPNHVTRYLKLSDRLADHGLVALLIAEVTDEALDIDTFLMSCRVIGRTVEEKLLAHLCAEAMARDRMVLRGTFVPTAKNAIVRDLYGKFGFRETGSENGATRWEYDISTHGPIRTEFIEELAP